MSCIDGNEYCTVVTDEPQRVPLSSIAQKNSAHVVIELELCAMHRVSEFHAEGRYSHKNLEFDLHGGIGEAAVFRTLTLLAASLRRGAALPHSARNPPEGLCPISEPGGLLGKNDVLKRPPRSLTRGCSLALS